MSNKVLIKEFGNDKGTLTSCDTVQFVLVGLIYANGVRTVPSFSKTFKRQKIQFVLRIVRKIN